MPHVEELIRDLALILGAGAITTLLFRRIRQPLVLGYIIAGFLVGPHFSILPSVVDEKNIKTLAEIGVIFLLFSLGLEFSFKKLVRVGGAASVTAFVEIICITVGGYFTGRWMGWSVMDSVFLGGLLASSSTTIIIRAFDELGVKTRQYARIVFGVLVVEDIVVILLMVLLSTMAVSKQFEGTEMLVTVTKLLFFLALWFIAGIFLLPTFLKRVKKLLNEETMLILSIGLCLGMVVLATMVGFSAELGAFIMGSIIAETTSAEKVEHLIKPVKDLFGAVFFVSIGMKIDPQAIIEYKWPVLIVSLLTIFGKLSSTTFGALLSGQSLKQSVQVGMSMAQIGEFAFIIATLGLTLGVTSDFLFPVAVGASAITTFTTPYMIKFSEPFYNLIVKILPERWLTAIHTYSSGTQHIQAESAWKKVFRSYANIVLTNGFVALAIGLLSLNFLLPFLRQKMESGYLATLIGLVVTLLVSAPFLWALMAKKPDSTEYRELWLDRKYNQGPLLAVEFFRNVLGILLVGLLVDQLFSGWVVVLIAVLVTIVVLVIFSQKIQSFYQRIEVRFLSNLNAREVAAARENETEADVFRRKLGRASGLVPWDAHIADMEVSQHATFIGKTLEELAWREQYGINVAYVKRGDKLIYAPGRYVKLLPFDHVGIIATDEQLQQFKPVFETLDEQPETGNHSIDDVVLQKIVVDEYNRLKGQTIRSSGIRERANGLIVGIEREGQRILNPDSFMAFEWGDVVWIVGDRKKIQQLTSMQPGREKRSES